MREFGTELAQTRAGLSGIVDSGWRVAALPTRVGTRARVPEEAWACEGACARSAKDPR
jgi:hypothetical protein